MAKYILLSTVALTLVVSCFALPRQYRYYPPPPSRFAGWTVTSEELLALPSNNEPNIVRVAPPPEFKPHRVTRRAVPVEVAIPSYAYMIPHPPHPDQMLHFS